MSLIEELTGIKGKYNDKTGVFRITSPRKDLVATANGVKVTPALAMTSWVAFKQAKKGTELMGDMVLTDDQVIPVIKTALDNGLKVTALDNRHSLDSPKVMFLHIEATGTLHELASAVNKVLQEVNNKTKTVPAPAAEIDPAKSTLDGKKIDDILYRKGTMTDGVYKITKASTTKVRGQEIESDMGVTSWAAFAGSDDNAVLMGDFAMKESDVQNVLKSLLKSKIYVVGIHNRMFEEDPKIVYVQYRGVGPAKDLALGLKDALAQIH